MVETSLVGSTFATITVLGMTPDEIRATLPAYNELMYPTIEVLRELGGSATTQEINAAVVEKLGLSEEAASTVWASCAFRW